MRNVLCKTNLQRSASQLISDRIYLEALVIFAEPLKDTVIEHLCSIEN